MKKCPWCFSIDQPRYGERNKIRSHPVRHFGWTLNSDKMSLWLLVFLAVALVALDALWFYYLCTTWSGAGCYQ